MTQRIVASRRLDTKHLHSRDRLVRFFLPRCIISADDLGTVNLAGLAGVREQIGVSSPVE